MDKDTLRKLLDDVRGKKVGVENALSILKFLPYKDLNFAKIDTHRTLRKGFPEVILAKGKSIKQIKIIVQNFLPKNELIMITKAGREVYEAIIKIKKDTVYYETAKIVLSGRKRKKRGQNIILVISAGTSDLPIAEEAAVTAEIIGNSVERLYDVGIAGLHRLLDNKEKLLHANVIIAVAGMEGALPNVIAGLVDKPVIAVPTSTGYGASFNGLSALLTMLNCCSPGAVVVNIDNGFGAGYFAGFINRMSEKN